MKGRARTPLAGDDASRAAWVALGKARPLAFDHQKIVRDAVRLFRREHSRRAISSR